MVLGMAKPAEQAAVSAFSGGVQADLAPPAPVIVVNGSGACQLRFSLLEPALGPQAKAFLDTLRHHHLGDIAPVRVAILPVLDAA